MKIFVFGGSGFIGSALISYLKERSHDVFCVSRNLEEQGTFYWNPEKGDFDKNLLEGADVVINLSGESIFGRWNKKKKESIEKSRLIPAEFLTDILLSLKNPPHIYIGASAIGYYGDRGNERLTEKSPPGKGFLADLCAKLEAIPQKLQSKNIRTISFRFGIVMGKGGALAKMEIPFNMGFGGNLGDGEQQVSWIALADLLSAFSFVLSNENLSGAINLTSPKPVTNKELTKTLGRILHRPTFFTIPRLLLYLLFESGAEVYLNSAQVFPELLLENGFTFEYPKLDQTLKKYLPIKS